LILAAVGILIGIELLADPLRGVVTLTIAVAILFLVTGIGKLFMAFEFRGQNGFWMFLISGALSVLLAIMVFNNFNEAAGRLLGLILAIELISNGVTMIAISMAVKRMGGATA
jgi:uncharacterized membrane protein HdeD (DUF308 family)